MVKRATLAICLLVVVVGILWPPSPVPALGQDAEQGFQQPTPREEEVGQKPSPQYPEPRGESLRYSDAVVLLAVLALGTLIAIKLRSRRWLVVLGVGSLLYFGFYRGGCVCPIGAIQNVVLSLVDRSYTLSIVVTAIVLLPIVFALFAGRIFCGGACPLGAVQDLLLRKPVHVPSWLDKPLRWIRWAYLLAAIYFVLAGVTLLGGLVLPGTQDFIICRYDPFISLFRLVSYRPALAGDWGNVFHFTGPAWMWAVTGAVLVLAIFVGRPYCRWVCPYGAILGVCARTAKRGVTVMPDKCCDCGLCEHACAFGAIENHAAVKSSCVACARCYDSCPLERERLGVPVADLVPASPVAEPATVPAMVIALTRSPVPQAKILGADDPVDVGYIDELVARCGQGQAAALPILQAIQDRHRYLPRPALERVCERTDLTMAQLTGISTFYNQFRLMPIGEHLIRICHGTACHVGGARRINDSLRLYLGIPPEGDTDPKRQFTIQEVACLGCCSLAPVMQIDGITFGHLSAETAQKAVESVRQGRVETDGQTDGKAGGHSAPEVGTHLPPHRSHHAHDSHSQHTCACEAGKPSDGRDPQ